MCFIQVFTFGRNNEGQLCAGNLQPSVVPVNVKALTGRPTVRCSIALFQSV